VGGKLTVKRPLGIPRQSWENNIKINFQAIVLGGRGLGGHVAGSYELGSCAKCVAVLVQMSKTTACLGKNLLHGVTYFYFGYLVSYIVE